MNSKAAGTTQRRAITLLLCWVGVYVVLFSLAQTKLTSYVTPCYPAIALLVGLFVKDWTAPVDIQSIWLPVGFAHLILVGLLLAIGIPLAAHRFLPGSEWLGCLGLVPIIGGTMCWWQQASERRAAAAISLASTCIAFCVLLHVVLPAEVGRHQNYGAMLQRTTVHAGPVVAFGHLEPSWIFYGGRPIREFGSNEKDEFLLYVRKNPTAIVITTEAKLESLGQEAAGGFDVVFATEYFLRNRELLLAQPVSADGRDIADRRRTRIPAR